MSWLSSITGFFSSFFSKEGAFDKSLDVEVKSAQDYLETKKEERHLQHILERDAKKAVESSKREEKYMRKLLKNAPQNVRDILKKVWSGGEQIKKDQLSIASGSLNPTQEAAITGRDLAVEGQNVQLLAQAEKLESDVDDKQGLSALKKALKSAQADVLLFKQEQTLEKAELSDDKRAVIDVKREEASEQNEKKAA